MPSMNGREYLPEVFERCNKTKSKLERVQILRDYVKSDQLHAKAMQYFVECMYHPNVVWELPEGAPPFKKNEAADYTYAGYSLFNFFNKNRHALFITNPGLVQNVLKREKLFVQELEAMHVKEAELLIMMKDGKMDSKKYPGLTYLFFREAFPDWLPVPPKKQKSSGEAPDASSEKK